MSTIPSADSILIRQKRTVPGQETEPAETSLSLAEKLKELFDEGYGQDDLFGLVIPLLMQGKIRINREKWMERLELEDKNLRLQRSPAIQIFDQYLNQRAAKKPAPAPLPKPATAVPKAATPPPAAPAVPVSKPPQVQPPVPTAVPKPAVPAMAAKPPQPVPTPKPVALPQTAAASQNPPKSPAPAAPQPAQDNPPTPVLKPRPTLIRRP